jgi:CHASE2 domain-containing sensor protein
MTPKFLLHLHKRHPSLLLAIALALGVLGLRLLIIGEPFELFLLDLVFKARPTEPSDPRIVIVAVDEPDIQKLKQWPRSDDILARVLTNLQTQNPRVITLDVYREDNLYRADIYKDFLVSPGSLSLSHIFQSSLQLIRIEHIGRNTVAPPSGLAERNRVSFSNLSLDSDGKARCAILAVNPEEPVKIGLATLIALQKPNQTFQSLSFDVLDDGILANLVIAQIVYIRGIAPSLNNSFLTPCEVSNTSKLPHVASLEVHAQITSQLQHTTPPSDFVDRHGGGGG